MAEMVVMSDDQDGSASEDQAAIENLRVRLSAALAKLRERLR